MFSEKLTAGYVAFGTQFYEPENLKAISFRAENQLLKAGINLVRTDPVYGEHDEPQRAIKELSGKSFDFLIINIINWVDTRGVFRVLEVFKHEPMVLYSFGGFTTVTGEFGYEAGTLVSPAAGAGSTSIRFPMELWGYKFRYLFNAPDTDMDVEGILRFGRACRVVKKLRKSRLGMIGWNDMGLYSTGFNETKVRKALGPEIESVDMLQLQKTVEKVSEKLVKEETKKITQNWEYPLGKPNDQVIEKAVRMYLATMDIIREKNFDAFSYKCVDGIDRYMGLTHAIPSSLVASAGIPYIDENDMLNLVSELMFKWLSGKQVTFLEHYEHHPEWILLGEDGYVPTDMIDGKPQIKDVSTVLLNGIAHCSDFKKGRMTLAAMAEDNEGFRMQLVTGEGKKPPRWVEMGVTLPSWPGISFYTDVPVKQILNHVLSQHYAAVFGDFAEEMRHICYLLNIKLIDDTDRARQ